MKFGGLRNVHVLLWSFLSFVKRNSPTFLMDLNEISFIFFVVYLKTLAVSQNTRCQVRG